MFVRMAVASSCATPEASRGWVGLLDGCCLCSTPHSSVNNWAGAGDREGIELKGSGWEQRKIYIYSLPLDIWTTASDIHPVDGGVSEVK